MRQTGDFLCLSPDFGLNTCNDGAVSCRTVLTLRRINEKIFYS